MSPFMLEPSESESLPEPHAVQMETPLAQGWSELDGGPSKKLIDCGKFSLPPKLHPEWPRAKLGHEWFPGSKHTSVVGVAIVSDGWLQLKKPRVARSPLKLALFQGSYQSGSPGLALLPAPPPETPSASIQYEPIP